MEELINPFKQNSDQELINPFKEKELVKPLPQNKTSALKQYGLGFVSGFDQPLYTAAGKLNTLLNKIPGVNIPMPPMEKLNMGKGTAYQMGRGAGEAAPYALTVLAPELGPGLTPEMATLSRMVLGGLYGGATSEDTLKGVLTGALEQGAAEGALKTMPYLGKFIKTGAKTIGKPIESIRPKKYLKETSVDFLNKNAEQTAKEAEKHLDVTIKNLGGSKDVNDITKSLADDIKNNATNIHDQYKAKLKPVEDYMANKNLYETPNGIIERTYNPMTEEFKDLKLGGANKEHKNFIENPTFDNADKLQKALGEEARSIKGIERSSTLERQNLYKLRENLKNDISNSIDKYDATGNLSKQYKSASDYYLNEYVPYKNIRPFTDISKKGATSDSILNAFKKPKIISGENKIPDAVKVANDLGDSGKQKIIALEMSKTKGLTPEKALSKYKDIETTGLSKYDTNTMESSMNELENKINDKQATEAIAKKFSTIKQMSPEDALRAYNEIKLDPTLNKYIPKSLDDTFKSLAKKIAAKKIATVGAGITGFLGAEKIAKKIGGLF